MEAKAKEIEEGNRLIAGFMELIHCTDPDHKNDKCYEVPYAKGYHKIRDMQYHTSWDWLKPVIDKIFTYALAHREQVDKIINISIVVDILPAWQAVVDFIKWYNQKQKQ
jgi:hypothetical protein